MALTGRFSSFIENGVEWKIKNIGQVVGAIVPVLGSILFPWLLDTDKGNLDIPAAVRTGYIKGNWLLHYPFRNGANNRIDII